MEEVVLKRGSLHIHLCNHLHLFLKCVHKYTEIYEAIGLLVLMGVVSGDEGLLHIHLCIHLHLFLNDVHIWVDIYNALGLFAL